jgi:hypothetical protein
MMNVLWVGKPSHYDTRNVERLWFEGRRMLYTVWGDNHVYERKASEVEVVLSDEAYAVREARVGGGR